MGYALLFVALMSTSFGQSIVFSILPTITRELGLRDSSIALIHSIPALIWALTSPFWGRASDVWGRRPIIVIGIFGWGISAFMFAFSIQLGVWGLVAIGPVYLMMIGTRSLFGLVSSGAMPAANAYVSERTSPAERTTAIATLAAANGIGQLAGPGVGAALIVFGLVTPFYATGILALVGAFFVWLYLPEERKPKKRYSTQEEDAAPRAWVSPLDPRVLPFFIIGTSGAVANSIILTTAGFYFADILGMSARDAVPLVGIALIGKAAAALLCQLVIIRMLKPSARLLLQIAPVITLIAYVIFLIATSLTTLVLALVLLGFGFALTQPGNTAGLSLSVDEDELGTANGMLGTANAMGFAVGPVIAMPLYEWWIHAPYFLNLGAISIALATAWLHPAVRRLGHPVRRAPITSE